MFLIIRSFIYSPRACRHVSNTAVKLWHRLDVNRLKSEAMMVTSENVVTKLRSENVSTFPTASIPIKLQVTVPRKNYVADMTFHKHIAEQGTFREHFVGNNAFTGNMLQYAKSNDAPESPQGEQGFLWRLTRPLEALRKRFMGADSGDHFTPEQEAKEKVEPVKAQAAQESPSPKSSAGPPKSP